ncbi:hypothetical protein KV112_20560 [Mycolicibacter sp. MYC123]|uniref:Uncharacterized protein n=1 Tax=[Mycobacterium] zoologicum TaxID=2872311 RepID=A0ABU5YPW4_9MYCO|nr:hypothetical protein [Mycolicibacter sp. MYC123]MEB3052107.1 hypothetical protein [Mycolicibacter sp. MYC123]
MRLARYAEPEEPPRRGFRDAVTDLVDRKLSELGGHWARETQRSRRAEAARRARVEMVRRVERQTGRRYAVSTIVRWAAHNATPPDTDVVWWDRWAAIDRAGGIQALADQTGATSGRVIAWRDSPDPDAPPPGRIPVGARRPSAEPQRIGVETDGVLTIGRTRIDDRRIPTNPIEPYEVLLVDPEVLDAWLADDTDTLLDLLSDAITDQVIGAWGLAPEQEPQYRVTDILRFIPNPS